MSLRAGLALGSAAAVVSALPAVVRLAQADSSWAPGWLALAGGTALVTGPVVALARAARPFPHGFWSIALGAALSAPLLAVFGRVLELKTHHRPLGAATFAVMALIVVAVTGFVTHRVVSYFRSRELPVWPALGVTGLIALVLLGKGALGAGGLRPSVLDAVLVCLFSTVAIALPLSPERVQRLRSLGLPIWGLLAFSAILLSWSKVGAAVGQAAPVLSPLNGW